jgi:hypothetical protein
MPDLKFSDHARDRMRERGVTEADVELALRHPFGNPSPGQPGSIWIEGHAVGGRILRVCVETADQKNVITLAWK